MPQEIECCGVHYIVDSPDSRCAFCEKKLKSESSRTSSAGSQIKTRPSGAQRRGMRKSGLSKPSHMTQEEYLEYLTEESDKFRLRQAQKKFPDLRIVCPCCEQIKLFSSFNWIRGGKPEYDFLSESYDEELFQAYAKFISEKIMICGQCRVNYAKSNLPCTVEEQYKKRCNQKMDYYMRTRELLIIPPDGTCPKCRRSRSLHPNAWAKTADGVVCRRCAAGKCTS